MPVPDDFTDPREVELPVLKKTAKVRFPRMRDDQYSADLTTLRKNLWRFVLSIDGCEDKTIVSNVLKKITMRDRMFLISRIFENDYGVDTRIVFDCPKCKEKSTVDLPISADFFVMS